MLELWGIAILLIVVIVPELLADYISKKQTL